MPVVSNPFTSPAGFDYRAVAEAARKSNLVAALYGSNGAPSAFALNNEQVVYRELHRRQMLQTAGPGGLSIRPTIDSGNNLVLKAQWASLAGRSVYLSGGDESAGDSDDDPIVIAINTTAPGSYALVLELFDSRVLPSTNSLPGLPPGPTGVASTANKRSGSALFANGNLRRTLDAGVGDAALLSGTSIQLQEFVQTQYRLSLVPDANLIGTASTVGNVGTGNYAATPTGSPYYDANLSAPEQPIVVATNANTDRAIDGLFFAAKLCLVRVTSIGGQPSVHLGSDNLLGIPFSGQRPLPHCPRLGDLGTTVELASRVPAIENVNNAQAIGLSNLAGAVSQIDSRVDAAEAQLAQHETRINTLELGNRPTLAETFIVTLPDSGSGVATLATPACVLANNYASRTVMVMISSINVPFATGKVRLTLALPGSSGHFVAEFDVSTASANDQQMTLCGHFIWPFPNSSTVGQSIVATLDGISGAVFDTLNAQQVRISIHTLG